MSVSGPMHESTNIPIKIHNQGDLPLYLQIKYQLSYLITTERIRSGARLPPVRTLAADLNINPHTAAQAYRELQNEGLIESSPGRGSFVREFDNTGRDEAERHALLTEMLRSGRRRARALGFTDEEIMQRLASLGGQEPVPCHVVFVDQVPHIAEKYANRLEYHLGSSIRATPLGLDAIARHEAAALETLEATYFVLAFARNIPSLERALTKLGRAYRLLTIVSEVLPKTGTALAKLSAEVKAILITEERYIHSSLNLLSAYSRLDPRSVAVFTADERDVFLTAAGSADVILYTFGVRDVVAEVDLSIPTLELTFDISPDSVEKLRHTFAAIVSSGVK